MVIPLFVTGTGTDVGKTLAAAVMVKALDAFYWKPVQAGQEPGTDTGTIRSLTGICESAIFPSSYDLLMPASPHIAARAEQMTINLQKIRKDFEQIIQSVPDTGEDRYLIVEGAGGLLVPLNDGHTIADLISVLGIPAVIVSRNYLGSINHSLLTAEVCRSRKISVAGWIFNDVYGDYTHEIVKWTGFPLLAKLPLLSEVNPETITRTAAELRNNLKAALGLQLAQTSVSREDLNGSA